MRKFNRREAIAAFSLAGGAAAMPAAAVAATNVDVKPPEDMHRQVAGGTRTIEEVDASYEAWQRNRERSMEAEVDEIIRYRKALIALETQVFSPALFVPMASVPIRVELTRRSLSKAERAIPEPKIPELYGMMHGGHCATHLDFALVKLAEKLPTGIPKGVQVQRDITIRYPNSDEVVPLNRVTTPRFCFDVEDNHFDCRRAAMLLADAVQGIWLTWDRNCKEMRRGWAAAAHEGLVSRRPKEEFQATPIQMHVKHDAFIRHIMWWNTGAGRIS